MQNISKVNKIIKFIVKIVPNSNLKLNLIHEFRSNNVQ